MLTRSAMAVRAYMLGKLKTFLRGVSVADFTKDSRLPPHKFPRVGSSARRACCPALAPEVHPLREVQVVLEYLLCNTRNVISPNGLAASSRALKINFRVWKVI